MQASARQREFRAVVEEHQSMVFSIALRLLGDCGLAEEVAQDCFVALYGVWRTLDGDDHTKFWLRRVAVHRATDALRRRAVRPEASGVEWDETLGAGASERSAAAMETQLERLLLSLPEAMRIVLVLRYGEDMLPDEIAAVLGQPVGTVKSNLQRGLELLRRKGSVSLKEFVR